jgi:mRNA deadenylase 3'-5' endonuclease subunit Ccr4
MIKRKQIIINTDDTKGALIRVMQWNVLAFALWSEEEDNKTLPKTLFDWNNFRFWRIIQEIVYYNSDIICLEEADAYEQYKPYLHDLG